MTSRTSAGDGLSPQERDAVKERAAEQKTQARRAKAADRAAADAADVLAKIAAMPDGDRALAERLHRTVAEVAPDLAPKVYYGQPGWARAATVSTAVPAAANAAPATSMAPVRS